MTLRWTRDVPSVAGWYWYRRVDPSLQWTRKGTLVFFHDDGLDIVTSSDEWAGPIPPPEEAGDD